MRLYLVVYRLVSLVLLSPAVAAVAVEFTSCVSNSVVRMGTYFQATNVDVSYDMNLSQVNVTVTGDMHGSLPDYSTVTNRLTTLQTQAYVLQYELSSNFDRFCDNVQGRNCPFGPQTGISFVSSYPLSKSYFFVSISTLLAVIDPTRNANVVACIRTSVTPTFTSSIYALLTYVPLGVLFLVGLSIVIAAIFNPWTGTKDFFTWSSNYGQDPDTLRLVTPGFGDMLQYLQFAYLMGSLNLNFPGFYQPALSAVGWSALQFNFSIASHESMDRGIDNVYSLDGQYGMSDLGQLMGMGKDEDLWTCFAVFFLIVCGAILVIAQVAFLAKWIWYRLTSRHSVDLRSKNWPVSGGMIIRVVFNYLALPLVTYCAFQLLVSPKSAVYISVLAGVLLFGWIVSAIMALRTIKQTKPQQALYDDLPTLLLLGPLYNTYAERGFMFCSAQLFCLFLRGIIFGAVQPSGIAQIVMIAIVEVIYFLSLNIVRPFHRTTSMNVYHIILSTIRLVITFLSIAFVPSLQVGNSSRGWVAYAILLLHSIVIIFVFFLHSLKTVVETLVRLSSVTGDTSNTFARAFGVRQLARRRRPKEKPDPVNLSNEDPVLGAIEAPVTVNMIQRSPLSQFDFPLRTPLYSSATPMSGPSVSADGTPVSPTSDSAFSAFPFYRMPRRTRLRPPKGSTWSVDDVMPYNRSSHATQKILPDPFYGESDFIANEMSRLDDDSEVWNSASASHTSRKVDYAVRESDVYFHARSSATPTATSSGVTPVMPSSTTALTPESGIHRQPLSSETRYSRRLGTGPADPNGVSAGVRGWFSKQMNTAADRLNISRRNKGFVVVRNAPMRTVIQTEGARRPAASAFSEDLDEEKTIEVGSEEKGKQRPSPLNIVIDQTIPKNTYTPIIKSPIPPAMRRQQQQTPQSQQLLMSPFAMDGPSTNPLRPLDSPPAVEDVRHTLLTAEEMSSEEHSTNVGEVRSTRVSDVIRHCRFDASSAPEHEQHTDQE
ncbi:hypothetical protein V1512DRAFT_134073 [Lipomyces arxii]|uniref:uncharacterized protein n=1 Tax=Lipomyces arxii TaxID=56418 RepID=UPI0034D008ED